tara:strand:- start:1426 stop:1632 length:207 start_codon:yes stop_codon:yes gene_type:complete
MDLSEKEIGKIMAKWAYIGVSVGLIGAYAYLGALKGNKSKLAVASLMVMGGLAVGSKLGADAVEKAKK